MKQLDRKAIWLFFADYLVRFFLGIFLTVFLVFGTFARRLYPSEGGITMFTAFSTILQYWPVVVVGLAIVSYVLAYFSWVYYRYELREDGFRKEMGIFWKKYVSIPYERIQNVDIYRGILARLLGLSDLQIQTAGMSTPTSHGAGSEGRILGILSKDAESLRDELIERARGQKSSGV